VIDIEYALFLVSYCTFLSYIFTLLISSFTLHDWIRWGSEEDGQNGTATGAQWALGGDTVREGRGYCILS
jgi:hypothetical protein